MALARTDLFADHFDNTGSVPQGTGPWTSGSFTPPDNCLLIACFQTGNQTSFAAADDGVLTDSAGLTWTKRVSRYRNFGPPDENAGIEFWTAPVTTGVSMMLTYTHTGVQQYQMAVYVKAYTGHDASDPIGATASGGQVSTTPGITLSGAPAASSEVLAMLRQSRGASTVGPGSGWTEINEDAFTGSFDKYQLQARSGSTSTAVDWTSSGVTGSPYDLRNMIAIEIKAAGAGGGTARSYAAVLG
jgi:hypothetical protein